MYPNHALPRKAAITLCQSLKITPLLPGARIRCLSQPPSLSVALWPILGEPIDKQRQRKVGRHIADRLDHVGNILHHQK